MPSPRCRVVVRRDDGDRATRWICRCGRSVRLFRHQHLLPANRDLLDRVDLKSWHGREQSRRALRRLREVTPHVVDFLDSPYSDSSNFWLHDPRHFKPDIGARLMEEAFLASERRAPPEAPIIESPRDQMVQTPMIEAPLRPPVQ